MGVSELLVAQGLQNDTSGDPPNSLWQDSSGIGGFNDFQELAAEDMAWLESIPFNNGLEFDPQVTGWYDDYQDSSGART